MKLLKLILLYLFLISPTQADTIYELIKIPNLEIYNLKTENKLRYLNAKRLTNKMFEDVIKELKC